MSTDTVDPHGECVHGACVSRLYEKQVETGSSVDVGIDRPDMEEASRGDCHWLAD